MCERSTSRKNTASASFMGRGSFDLQPFSKMGILTMLNVDLEGSG